MASSNKSQIFDAKKWLEEFQKPGKHKSQRVEIIEQTLKVCEEFQYTLPNGKEVIFGDFESVSRDAQATKLYVDRVELVSRTDHAEKINTNIEVVNRDCLEEAIRLKTLGLNPAVLNMASPRRPGRFMARCLTVFPSMNE